MRKQGLFIVFEGIDGSGQDTQAKLLQEALEKMGHNVWLTSEPTDERFGSLARQIMRGNAKHPGALGLQNLMVLDRGNHTAEIEDYLADGSIVICVRYLYSSLAYGQADGLSYDTLWKANENFVRPNLAIYLDIDPAKALGRVEKRTKESGQPLELFERKEFLVKVKNNFQTMIGNPTFKELQQVEAKGNRKVVHERVMGLVQPLLTLN